MKKLDTLNKNLLQPRKATVEFLLKYSKNIATVSLKQRLLLVSKN